MAVEIEKQELARYREVSSLLKNRRAKLPLSRERWKTRLGRNLTLTDEAVFQQIADQLGDDEVFAKSDGAAPIRVRYTWRERLPTLARP